jgi:hypothetical protein
MAISPEYLGLLRSSISSSPEWKEAWERTNDYLDALRIPADLERELMLLSSFERAIASMKPKKLWMQPWATLFQQRYPSIADPLRSGCVCT